MKNYMINFMGAMGMQLEQHLFALEQALQQCTTRSDTERLAQLLAHDFVEFGASGNVWGSKAEVIAGLKDEVFSARRMTEFAVKLLGQGLALVTYRCHREGVGDSLRSSVWREEEGQWRMVFHQGTPAAAPSPQRGR
ncbi:nuclear transport factor 2 family protein [Pseudomonas sp. ArH3a]|uniref:nuclear transport factor 2 family protein n=1 Tax=Pseudomonas sp. ArH3a TaxID=2862945 RepID=UPI001F589B5D|nr:nuclear transport factor 2 family protein [Pseudomonas sp. ArH3a]